MTSKKVENSQHKLLKNTF